MYKKNPLFYLSWSFDLRVLPASCVCGFMRRESSVSFCLCWLSPRIYSWRNRFSQNFLSTDSYKRHEMTDQIMLPLLVYIWSIYWRGSTFGYHRTHFHALNLIAWKQQNLVTNGSLIWKMFLNSISTHLNDVNLLNFSVLRAYIYVIIIIVIFSSKHPNLASASELLCGLNLKLYANIL